MQCGHRSAVRRVTERDEVAGRFMILVVSAVHLSPVSVELTDGWYGIKANVDEPLAALVRKGTLALGTKLGVCGAEVSGDSGSACNPLSLETNQISQHVPSWPKLSGDGVQACESLTTSLSISYNSTRPFKSVDLVILSIVIAKPLSLSCRWDMKLGFQPQRAFPVRLASLVAGGGAAGCVDLLIIRRFATRQEPKACCVRALDPLYMSCLLLFRRYLVTGAGDGKRVLSEVEEEEESRVRCCSQCRYFPLSDCRLTRCGGSVSKTSTSLKRLQSLSASRRTTLTSHRRCLKCSQETSPRSSKASGVRKRIALTPYSGHCRTCRGKVVRGKARPSSPCWCRI